MHNHKLSHSSHTSDPHGTETIQHSIPTAHCCLREPIRLFMQTHTHTRTRTRIGQQVTASPVSIIIYRLQPMATDSSPSRNIRMVSTDSPPSSLSLSLSLSFRGIRFRESLTTALKTWQIAPRRRRGARTRTSEIPWPLSPLLLQQRHYCTHSGFSLLFFSICVRV
jgi:hypothetical protein